MKLDVARRFALSLPEATDAPHFHYASFRVQGKIFATAPPDGEHLHVFVADDERDAAMAVAPACVENLLWGGASSACACCSTGRRRRWSSACCRRPGRARRRSAF
jgi:hypothetical protein